MNNCISIVHVNFRPGEKHKEDKYYQTKHNKVVVSEMSFGEYIEKELRKAGR